MRIRLRHGSLTRRVFIGLIAGEMLFATVLGLTVGVFSAVSVATQRAESIRQLSAVIAAGLMPMIADQQEPQVQAQLDSILEAANVRDVVGICLRDSSGSVLACQGAGAHSVEDEDTSADRPWAVLLEEQVVVQPVVVGGLPIAELRVWFAPPGLDALLVPLLASAVILVSVMAVSVPWTAWLLARDVLEPLDDLGRYALQIAEGDLDPPLDTRSYSEILELQDSLASMARQLRLRDEQLQGSYSDLSQAYDSLETAKTEIEALSTIKSNFVAVAAHEIRGPLSTIRVYAELLESGGLGRLDETTLDAVSAIGAASARLVSIVSDLMDSALLERGLMRIDFSDVHVDDLVDGAVQDAALIGKARCIEVAVEGDRIETVIAGDPLRLRQVLDNLLSNALKYSPDDSAVRVRTREDGDRVEIEVADQGRGIPAGGETRLFALFGRMDFGESRDTAGLGLGLAISARIVKAHGGSITHRPNDGAGSIFTVNLPVNGPQDGRVDHSTVRVVGGPEDR